MLDKHFDFESPILRRESVKKYPKIKRYIRSTLVALVPETDIDVKRAKDDSDLDDEEREWKKKENLFHEKYPKACALVKAELAKKGKYDHKYKLSKPIEKITVADVSETTLKYLENWDSLEFGVNTPNLKSSILRGILFRDCAFILSAKNNKGFMSYLGKINMTLEQCIADLQLYVDAVVSESQLFRATDCKVLVNHILAEDERWKSQFETRTSGGCLDPSFRSRVEERFFGFPDYSSDEASTADESSPYHVSKRPIYGFFTPNENGILNRNGTQPPPNLTCMYGEVHCKVKKSKYAETTIVFGDSLDALYGLTPLIKPHYTSLDTRWPDVLYWKIFDVNESGIVMKEINVANLSVLVPGCYTETQIHNGLRMKDIESLHVSKGNEVSDYYIEKLRFAVDKYNSKHPDSPVELIVY